jgi:hypothetical protein
MNFNSLLFEEHVLIFDCQIFTSDDPNRAIATMQSASRAVRLRHPVHMATIQVEPFDDLMATCEFCQPLQ